MLDKTSKEEVKIKPVDTSAPAIFVRVNTQVGQSRTMEMSFGIPLDMTPSDLNQYIDKVTACADRQKYKGVLEDLRLEKLARYRDLETNLQNQSFYQTKQETDWYAKGKLGPWKPTGSEEAQLKGFHTTETSLRQTVIPQLEKQIAELEEKIK